ncbi:MAG TPA: SURF1 family protein [Longimicrobiales bacterium]|nr:SURF1 family protein [Longimicrobiales bacterium]
MARSVSARDIVGSILIVFIAAGCVRLGLWQLDRLQQKKDRNAAIHQRMQLPPVRLGSTSLDSTGIAFRQAVLSGSYDDVHTIILAGRSMDGAPGIYVLTPVRVGDAGFLVNRGWLPSADAANVDVKGTQEIAPDSIEGLIVEFSRDPRTDRDTSEAFRRVWYHLNHDAAQKKFSYPIANFIVQLLPASAKRGTPRRVDVPVLDEGPHLSYAIQWFSFAIIGLLGWFFLMLRSRNSTNGETR